MAAVVVLTAVLAVTAVTLLDIVTNESGRSAKAVKSSAAFQAAEAGIDDYIAKLLDDHAYYMHYVHAGEATRRGPSGTSYAAGATWTEGVNPPWTYPSGKDKWYTGKKPLANGYEYDLQITPPTASSPYVHILSTGRPSGSTDTSEWRAIEALVRQSSVSDFFMMANADVNYGTTATTYGKVYAGIDSSGVKHNVDHPGTAYADVYAEGQVTGSTTLMNGAKKYDSDSSPDIRSVIKTPPNFSNFVASIVDVQRASQVPSPPMNFDNPAKDAWRLTFNSGGTVSVQTCMRVSGADVAQTQPTCTTYAGSPFPVPANGAIYTGQTAIVSGTVKGRVTVASNDDVVIPDNISYVTPGQDVLGLVAKNDVIVAQWAPYDVTIRGSLLAQTGARHSWSSDGSHGTATFIGSTATNKSPYMDMFQVRNYNYDTNLAFLPPPWFPTVDGAYTVALFREVKP